MSKKMFMSLRVCLMAIMLGLFWVFFCPGAIAQGDLRQFIQAWMSANEAGKTAYKHGKFAEADTALRAAIKIAEDYTPNESQGVTLKAAALGNSLNTLAIVCQHETKFAESAELLQRAITLAEKTGGSDSPQLAACLSNLGELYRTQGRDADAEPLYKRAIAITEKSKASDADLSGHLNNLGCLYMDHDRFVEAEAMLTRAQVLKESIYGSNSMDAALMAANIASMYKRAGKPAQAETNYKKALAIYEKLQPDHIETALCVGNLGELYTSIGNFADAEPLNKRALEMKIKALGPNHPSVALALNNIGMMNMMQRNLSQAESMFRQAIAIDEKILPPNHPDLVLFRKNLANVLAKEGKESAVKISGHGISMGSGSSLSALNKPLAPKDKWAADAKPIETLLNGGGTTVKRSPAPEAKSIPPAMTTALDVMNMPPDTPVYKMGEFPAWEKLESEGQQAIRKDSLNEAKQKLTAAIKEAELNGPKDERLANSLAGLALVFEIQGKHTEAQALYKRALSLNEKHLGSTSSRVSATLRDLSVVCLNTKKYAEAEAYAKRALSIDEQKLGPEHHAVGEDLEQLTHVYNAERKFSLADQTGKRALAIEEKCFGRDNVRLRINYLSLATSNLGLGKTELAKGHFRKALDLGRTTPLKPITYDLFLQKYKTALLASNWNTLQAALSIWVH